MMVFEKEDIRRIRTKIYQLYQDKRIIVAPCRCKVYMSHSSPIIDQEGKTSYNWVYFATGVTSLIYDHDARKLMMTLFDQDSLRLLWMLKLDNTATVRSPTSCFHIVSARDDLSEHVGLLYESKEVASLLLNTFLLLANRRVPNSQRKDLEGCASRPCSTGSTDRATNEGGQKKRRSKLFRSLSFHGRKSINNVTTKSEEQPRRLRSKTLGPEHFNKLETTSCHVSCRLSSPECQTNENYSPGLSSDDGAETKAPILTETARPTTSLIKQKILSRRSAEQRSSLKVKSNDVPHESLPSQQSEKRPKASSLFKRRKVCRTLSEKLPSKPALLNEENCTLEVGQDSNASSHRRYQPKPRSRSDTLLVRGSVVNCIVETGHMAKFLRHRKQWIRSLESGNLVETDLCVTEL